MTAVLLERLIGVVVVDDNFLKRGALRFSLERFPNLKVLGEAVDGYEAIEMVVNLKPDVVLMDAGLPVLGGIEATRIISSQFPETRVIVFTKHSDQTKSDLALQAGACQFLTKDSSPEKVLDAIRACSSVPFKVVGHPPH
jgi:DNA-binding NarL/FixJ family response regulator